MTHDDESEIGKTESADDLCPDMDPAVWVAYSERDLDRAGRMLRDEDWEGVSFYCQQAIEKRLKAVIVRRTGALPPKVHDLPHLARRAGLEVEEELTDFFLDLTEDYITDRYPHFVLQEDTEKQAQVGAQMLARTQEVIAWLDQLLK